MPVMPHIEAGLRIEPPGVGAERGGEEAGGKAGTAATRRAAAEIIAAPWVAGRRLGQIE